VKDNASALPFNQSSSKDLFQVGFLSCILSFGLLPCSALAQSAAAWSQMKADCRSSGGQPASEYYSEWVSGGGCVCSGTPSNQPTCSAASLSSNTSSSGTTNALAGTISSGLRGLTPQQTMGVGLTVLALAALMQAPDPQQQAADQAAEAAQQEALRQQQEQIRQDQERRAEATKQELLHSLKGISATSDLGLKDTASGSGPQLTLKDTGASGGLQLKTGDSTPPPKTVIHDGFNLPAIDPSRE
jgi:hypothetical protein